MKRFSKVIALVLAMVMVISMLPVFASAEEPTAEPVTDVTETNIEAQPAEPEAAEPAEAEPAAEPAEIPAETPATPAEPEEAEPVAAPATEEAKAPAAEEEEEEVKLLSEPVASYQAVSGDVTEFETLSLAITAAQTDPDATASEGGTVTLLTDYAMESSETGYNKVTLAKATYFANFSKAMTLDLDGHTLTSPSGNNNCMFGQDGSFTDPADYVVIRNGKIVATGGFLQLGKTAAASSVARPASTFSFEALDIIANSTTVPFNVVMPSFRIMVDDCTVYTGAANPTFTVNQGGSNSAGNSLILIRDSEIYAFNAKSANGLFYAVGGEEKGCRFFLDNVDTYHGTLNANATYGVFGKDDVSQFLTSAGDPVAAMVNCGQEITIGGIARTYNKRTNLLSPDAAAATASLQSANYDDTLYYTTLNAAVFAAKCYGGGTVTLLKDVTMTQGIAFDGLTSNLTVDLGGYTVNMTGTGNAFGCQSLDDDVTLTIQNGFVKGDVPFYFGADVCVSEAAPKFNLSNLHILGGTNNGMLVRNNFKNGEMTVDNCVIVAPAGFALGSGQATGQEGFVAANTVSNTRIYTIGNDAAIRLSNGETWHFDNLTVYHAAEYPFWMDEFTGGMTTPSGYVMDIISGSYTAEAADATAFAPYYDLASANFGYKTLQVPGYIATFRNEGVDLESQALPTGHSPVMPATDPTKEMDYDLLETYTFDGWSSDGGTTIYRAGDDLPGVTADVVYEAVYITVPVPDEDIATATFTQDGSTLYEKDILKGTAPAFVGEVPTKAADAEYSYTFTGWSKEGDETVYDSDALPVIDEDTEFVAQFKARSLYTASYTGINGKTTKYDSLTAALQAAMKDTAATVDEGGTVTLLNDIELNDSNFDVEKGNVASDRLIFGNFNKAVTIDLGGHTITSTRITTPTGGAASLYVFGLNENYASKVVIQNGKLIVLTPSVANSCVGLSTFNDWTNSSSKAKTAAADWTVKNMFFYTNANGNMLVGTRMPYSKITVEDSVIVSGNKGATPLGAYSTTAAEFQPEIVVKGSRIYTAGADAVNSMQATKDNTFVMSDCAIYAMGTKGTNKFLSCASGASLANNVRGDIGWGLEDCAGNNFTADPEDLERYGEYLNGLTFPYKWAYVERPVASWDTDGDGEIDDWTTLKEGDIPAHEAGSRPLDTESRKVFFFLGWLCSTDDQLYGPTEILPAIGTDGVTFTAQFEEQEVVAAWDAPNGEYGYAATTDGIPGMMTMANGQQNTTVNILVDYELTEPLELDGVTELNLYKTTLSGDYGIVAMGTQTAISDGIISITASPAILAQSGDLTMTDLSVMGEEVALQFSNVGADNSIENCYIFGGSGQQSGTAIVADAGTIVNLTACTVSTGAVEPVFTSEGAVYLAECDIYPNAEYVENNGYTWFVGNDGVASSYRLSRNASFTVPFVGWTKYYRLTASTPVASYAATNGSTTQYMSLTEAIKAAMNDGGATATKGGVVTLLQDLYLDNTNMKEEPGNVDSTRVVYGNFNKAVTIDLGGHILSYNRTTTSKGAEANSGVFGLQQDCATKVLIQNGTIVNQVAQSNAILVLSNYSDWTSSGNKAREAKADWTFRNVYAVAPGNGNQVLGIRMPYAKVTVEDSVIVGASTGTNTVYPIGAYTSSPDDAAFQPELIIKNSRLYSTSNYPIQLTRNATVTLIDTVMYGAKSAGVNMFANLGGGATYDSNVFLPDEGAVVQTSGTFQAEPEDIAVLPEYLDGKSFAYKWTIDTPDSVRLVKSNGAETAFFSLTEAIAAHEEGDTLVLDQNFTAEAAMDIPDTLKIDTKGYALTLKAGTTVGGVTLNADTPINTDLNLKKVSLTLKDTVKINVKFDSFVPTAQKDGVEIADSATSGSMKVFSFEVDKADFATEYTIQATDGMAYGLPVKVSVLKYAQAAVAGGDNKLAKMVTALMYYGDNAVEYDGLGEKETTLSQYDAATAGVLTATDFSNVTYADATNDNFAVSYTDVYGSAAGQTAAGKTFPLEAANVMKELTITDGETTVTDTLMNALKAGGQLYAAIYGYYASQYFGK